MKTRNLFFPFLQFVILCFISSKVNAVSIPSNLNAEDPWVLIAEKDGRAKYYALGESVRIEYDNGNRKIRVKGFITRITADSIEISQFGGNLVSTIVNTGSIVSVTKLKRKQRKAIGIIAGSIALVLGILAITTKGQLFTSAWAFALIGIPAIASGYVLLIALGISYLTEMLNKCSVKNNWKFRSGTRPLQRYKLFKWS